MATGDDDRTGTVRHELRALRALAREMIAVTERAGTALERALHEGFEGRLKGPVTRPGTGSETAADPLPPPDPHLALHRPGTTSRIEADPELRAFIIARLERMTFAAIVADAVLQVPPDRRPSLSGLHRWWTRYRRDGAGQGGRA